MSVADAAGSLPILRAQQRALSRDERIDTLNLNPLAKGVPSLPVADSIVSASATLTIEGASTVALGIHDPKWLVEESGVLTVGNDRRMHAMLLTVDALRFRLVQASRKDPETLTLTFEDEAATLLRVHSSPLTASRGSMTRAQFIEKMVREVKVRRLPFFCPEKGRKQPVTLPDLPHVASSPTAGGFDTGASFEIKGEAADAEQVANVAEVMTIADGLDVSPRVRLASLVGGIGESEFKKGAAEKVYGTHKGVYQSDQIPAADLKAQATHFFQGGRSFLAGGAIQLARENPAMSVGLIAAKVEISDGSEAYYQSFHDEAVAIADAWSSGNGTGGSSGGGTADDVVRVKSFQFTRGKPGEKETSWDAATRLAADVGWRFFAMGGVIWFVSDDFLVTKPAAMILDGPHAAGLLEPPTYDWDHGKTVGEVDLSASANRWGVHPGGLVALRKMGPVTGRWITKDVVFDLLAADQTQVTLTKPGPLLKEPAPDTELTSPNKAAASRNVPKGGKVGYPLAKKAVTGGGPAEHAKRALGNWQSDNAVDLLIDEGTQVLAVGDGTVVKLGGSWDGTGQSNPNGFNFTLKTASNEWFYTHLRYRSPRWQVGMAVKEGDLIGASGAAAGVKHLHIACRKGDPMKLLELK